MTEPTLQPSGAPGPEAVNQAHLRDDLDASPLAHHHTLGQLAVQASPGNHTHTGSDSRRLTAGTALLPPTGGSDGVLLVGNSQGWQQSPAHSAGDRLIAKPGVGAGIQWTVSPGCLMPVRTVATTNINIASPGTPTTDGIAWASGNRVLLAGQTTAADNGVYLYTGSGNALARVADADLAATLAGGILIPVLSGTMYAGTTWQHTTVGAITLGATALTFVRQSRLMAQLPQLVTGTSNATTSGATALTLLTLPAVTLDGLTAVQLTMDIGNVSMTAPLADVFVLRFQEGATVLRETRMQQLAGPWCTHSDFVFTPAAGSHTYTSTLTRASGGGTATVAATATVIYQLMLKEYL